VNLSFLFTGANWSGSAGIPHRVYEHLDFTVISLIIALVVVLPVAIAAGHTNRFGFLAINISNVGRAVPSVAFLGLASQLLPHGYSSSWPTIIALVLLALPPLVTNTYVGMREADPDAVDAARGMGMSATQVALRVEFPLALPLAMAGIRTAVTNVIATATLAALVAQGGLGRFIIDGVATGDDSQLVAGAVLVALLAIGADLLLAGITQGLSPVARAGQGPGRLARLRRARHPERVRAVQPEPAGA
jgi:osmoprotectant transport system permease protein